jgi:hypothetical protein
MELLTRWANVKKRCALVKCTAITLFINSRYAQLGWLAVFHSLTQTYCYLDNGNGQILTKK